MALAAAKIVLRVKRKAGDDPVDGLLLAFKKQKCDDSEDPKFYFKFTTTLNNQEESIKDVLQTSILKERASKYTKWRDPKEEHSIGSVREKVKNKLKAESDKKRLDLINTRRLIFAETVQVQIDEKQDGATENSDVLKLFQLYDATEDVESELPKAEDEKESKAATNISCNGIPLIREKSNAYVYDVYISENCIDSTFKDGTVSIEPCPQVEELVYSDASEEEEVYEDEDDSNDENNWRNDYPDEDDFPSDGDSFEYGEDRNKMYQAFDSFDFDDKEERYESLRNRIKRAMKGDVSSNDEDSD